ncbi:MAG TPA: squalene/phytoene synthase family protein, partial [Ramlibacter sp.]|nr:squalene/phytoene synthase family protein [Ramlibacter sp.]
MPIPPSFPPPAPPEFLALLRGVSRSFYLSIRLLPAPLRRPIAVAYLLARATDTLADTAELQPEERQRHLQTLARVIDGRLPPAVLPALATDFAPLQHDAHERALIRALPQCLAWLEMLAPDDQHDIRTVLRHITHGQALDIERFGPAGSPRALATADALEEYTYLVAGSVGEFWTDLCLRHV